MDLTLPHPLTNITSGGVIPTVSGLLTPQGSDIKSV